jgi:hypothetical protein
MAETKFNPNAIRKLGEEIKRKYVHDWQAIHDAVWRTHAGQPKEQVRNWYERRWMPPAPTDRLLVVAGELRSTVRPSGTGASGSKRRSGRPVIVRWAASPS